MQPLHRSFLRKHNPHHSITLSLDFILTLFGYQNLHHTPLLFLLKLKLSSTVFLHQSSTQVLLNTEAPFFFYLEAKPKTTLEAKAKVEAKPTTEVVESAAKQETNRHPF